MKPRSWKKSVEECNYTINYHSADRNYLAAFLGFVFCPVVIGLYWCFNLWDYDHNA